MVKINQTAAHAQELEDVFGLTKDYASYVSKPEITDLAPNFLVKGSKNVMIDYAKRIVSRNGYTLFGAVNDGGGPIVSSYEWDTSTAKQLPIRTRDGRIEFYWNAAWNLLKSGFASSAFEFAKIFDTTEKKDVLIGVMGDTNCYKWSGGASKIASSTTTTVTKQGVIGTGNLGTVTMTIATPSVASRVAHGLVAGDMIKFGTTGALPTGVTTNTLYYVIATGLTADAFEFSATLAGAAINTSGSQSGVHTLYKQTRTNGIAFVAGTPSVTPATITDSLAGFVTAGFAAGDTLTVTGSTSNNRNFTIASVVAGVITLIMSDVLVNESAGGNLNLVVHNGEPTWSSARFATTGSIEYGGVTYAYTGGTSTDTLTGLSAFPIATAGDLTWQTVVTLANSGDINVNFKQDLVGVQLNQLVLASTKNQEIYISKDSDYTDFALTSPRVPGDPAKVTMDNYATCIIPMDNLTDTASSLLFGGGTSEFFRLSYQMAQDNSNELVRMIKLKTATGSGLISKDAICTIKNANAYISREPSLDTLGSIEVADGTKNVPLSDLIKNDFDQYDFTGAHMKYWKRAIYVAVPKNAVVLIYDLMRGLWQPPQTIAISRLAVIGDWLYGHSAITNETYKLFVGTDDNGVNISQVARFAYNNGGDRSRLKNMNEYWTDGYITANGLLNLKIGFNFDGVDGIITMPISGGDTTIVNPQPGSTIGDTPIGQNPLGGSSIDQTTGLPGQNAPMLRFRQIDTAKEKDYFEHFVEYSMNTLGGQFALVAHGSDQFDAGTSPNSIKK